MLSWKTFPSILGIYLKDSANGLVLELFGNPSKLCQLNALCACVCGSLQKIPLDQWAATCFTKVILLVVGHVWFSAIISSTLAIGGTRFTIFTSTDLPELLLKNLRCASCTFSFSCAKFGKRFPSVVTLLTFHSWGHLELLRLIKPNCGNLVLHFRA